MSKYQSKTLNKVEPKEEFHTCRLCKKNDRSVINKIQVVVDIIERITQIQFDLSAEMPQFVCNLCVHRLYDANTMREMCIESEAALHDMVPDFEYKDVEIEIETIPAPGSPSSAAIIEHVKEEADEDTIEDAELEPEMLYEIEANQASEAVEDTFMEVEQLEDDDEYLLDEEEDEEAIEVEEIEETEHVIQLVLKRDVGTRTRSPPREGENSYQRKLRKLKEKREANRRMGIKPPKRWRTCCQCPFRTEKTADLDLHFQTEHSNERMPHKSDDLYVCHLCWKVFDSREEKLRHSLQPRKKHYKCDECPETFDSIETYRTHLRAAHNIIQEFKCDECPRVYSNVNSLRGHKATVHKGVRHVCDECGATYKRVDTLREHLNIHRQEKPFACTQCDARFHRKTGLSSHMRTHSGIRPYACEFCDRTFVFASDKKRHLPVHTGVYQYNCEICSRGFTRKKNMEQHMAQHDKE